MYGLYISAAYLLAFLAGSLIVGVSMRPSRAFYWIALLAYTVLVAGTGLVINFPIFFNIGMAKAFNPHSVSPIAYAGPLFFIAMAVVPALALYPFISLKAARHIAVAFFGIPLAIEMVYTIVTTSGIAGEGMRGMGGSTAGFLTLFVLLLWLRVYAMRVAVSEPNEAPKNASEPSNA